MVQHGPTCIQVLIDEGGEDGPPDEPEPPPRACQLVPPCKEGNHLVQSGCGGTDTRPRTIGRYFVSENALKHDLAALRRGKVYTKQEFYRRARAWYKAEIDRILHWHKVYKENNPEGPKTVQVPEPKPEPVDKTNQQNMEGNKLNGISREDHNRQEVETKGGAKPQESEVKQDTKPKSRQKKVKVPAAPTRIQPPRSAKRKPEEPPLQPKVQRKKRKVQQDVEEPTKLIPANTKEQPPPTNIGEENAEETKGDYELSLDEWKIFLAKYNSATSPVTPVLPSAFFSSFSYVSQNHLQGIDVAEFSLRLERVVEVKIKYLIDERQGITIDEATGGLCLRGYYHHPFRCALDGNYVPPPRFEPAGAYSPGEDWRLHVASEEDSRKGGATNTETKPVSPATYRPPGSRNRMQAKISGQISLPSTASQQQHAPPIVTIQAQPQTNSKRNNDISPSIPPPQPNSPLENPPRSSAAANNAQHILKPEINISGRNSPPPTQPWKSVPPSGDGDLSRPGSRPRTLPRRSWTSRGSDSPSIYVPST